MKRLTSIVCCLALMITGVSLVLYDRGHVPSNTITAQPVLQWAPNATGLPLDLRLSSDTGSYRETPIKDSINIIDSVRVVEKVRWKTRYKIVADHTEHREAGVNLTAVNPDSLPVNLASNSMSGREEKPDENMCSSKEHLIQLSVDGQVVYSSENDNHSTEEGQ